MRLRIPVAMVALPLAVALGVAAGPAQACSVCLSATDETRDAYYLTTALMIAVPFTALGSLLWWLRRVLRSGGTGGPES